MGDALCEYSNLLCYCQWGIEGIFCRKELRQGDPLSTFLFVVCVVIMSRIMGTTELDRVFYCHPKCLRMKLTHVCFAENLMLFLQRGFRVSEVH